MNVNIGTEDTLLAEFRDDVLRGLARAQKTISPRWLYDQTGSKFFEQITDLPEYYVTRTEVALLGQAAAEFAAEIGAQATVVEYGAGAAIKVRLLLDALEQPAQYVAIDISYDHLRESLKSIASDYPDIEVQPLSGNFMDEIELQNPIPSSPKVGFFPGSTIGNMSDDEIGRFLRNTRSSLGDGAYLLLGADLRKSPDILIPAYDDAAGVTAQFNMNLLTRINRELSGDIDLSQFAHKAVWSDELSQIEMHLESLADQTFHIADHEFSMARGETIHTENSRKFSRESLENLTSKAGWTVSKYATDPKQYFALTLLKAS